MEWIDVHNWAWSQSGLPASTKFVLMALVKHSKGDCYCWPSIGTLAANCNLGRSTIQYHLGLLEKIGLIRKEERFVDGINNKRRQTSNGYFLNADVTVGIRAKNNQVIEQDTCDFDGNGADQLGGGADQPGPRGRHSETPGADQLDRGADTSAPGGLLVGHQELSTEQPKEFSKELPVEESREDVATSNFEVASSASAGTNKTCIGSFSDKLEARKSAEIQRLKGWAELEHERGKLSPREQEGARRAIKDACSIIEPSEVTSEVWKWDFIDDEEKTLWQRQVEAPYC